jgi:hypothetical protein
MASTKTLVTAFGVTVALALGGLQSSVAEARAKSQNQGIREVPRPDQSLLKPQPAPDCAFTGPLSNPPTAEETRMKLDYEQQCYRQSEMIVRSRLGQLQKSVEEVTKPANRRNLAEGERHRFVRHPGSGTHRTRGHPVVRTASHHRTSGHPVVRTASYLGYPALGAPFGRSYAYWRPRHYAYYLGYPTWGGPYYRYRYFGGSYAYWQPYHYAYHAYRHRRWL